MLLKRQKAVARMCCCLTLTDEKHALKEAVGGSTSGSSRRPHEAHARKEAVGASACASAYLRTYARQARLLKGRWGCWECVGGSGLLACSLPSHGAIDGSSSTCFHEALSY